MFVDDGGFWFSSHHVALNLRLVCTHKTRTRETLDVWPALPLIVEWGGLAWQPVTDNIIAALGYSNRVCEASLDISDQEVLATMQVPFSEFTALYLSSYGETPPAIPDLFLGGSAPNLRRFVLLCIPFPGLPNLLLSTTHLVELWIASIPHSWYISPEAIVASLSTLSSLEKLYFEFASRPHPLWEPRRLHLHKRSILPALENFQLGGVIEYLEDLVTLIDAPRLNSLSMTLYNERDFDIRRLAHFINRTPKLNESDEAHVELDFSNTHIQFGTQVSITFSDTGWQLSSVSQIGSFSITSAIKNLYIGRRIGSYRRYDPENEVIENTLWLQVLIPFTAARNLYLHKEFAPSIAAALKELVGGRITEVLPSLQNIFVEELEPFEKDSAQFVIARQLSGHPIAIFDWVEDSDTESI